MANGSLHPLRSLKVRNYRVWAAGALVSNVGTWMQRVAQDWLVLTVLTHNNATAVGVTSALQFGPQLFLMPFTGWAADHVDRRRLLAATQGGMGLLALGLGLLTLSGHVQLWHVYGFALMLGCVSAFDAPARQTFVAELVGDDDLANAVALNAASFNAGRLIGPAVAGLVIAATGSGLAFIANAFSFLGVLGSLALLRRQDMHPHERPQHGRGSLMQGIALVRARPDLKAVMAMLFLVGTFGLNFAIFISTMSVRVYHAGAQTFGLLTSTMAVGSVAGALLAARRERPTLAVIGAGAALFGVGCGLAAVMPNELLFGATMVGVGVAAQTVTNSSSSLVQLSTERALRGRVVALLLAVVMGGTLIGGPFVGWVADAIGPRWAMGVACLSGLGAAAIAWAERTRTSRLAGRPA